MANWILHWRIGLFGPPWFRVMRQCWGMYRAGVPIVRWDDVKDLCQLLADTEQRLEDTESDYHRWHDAYLRLKYPNMGERISGTEPCSHCDGSGVTAVKPGEKL